MFRRVDCSKKCETEEECTLQEKECKTKDNSKSSKCVSSIHARFSASGPSLEYGRAGPVFFTSRGPVYEFGRTGNVSFTSRGIEFRF